MNPSKCVAYESHIEIGEKTEYNKEEIPHLINE